MTKEGTGTTLPIDEGTELGKGDFTVEHYLKVSAIDPGKAAPDDGEWHSVSVSRGSTKTSVHGSEYIGGVLFCFARAYGKDGRLETIQYTRADLVKG